MSDKKMLFVNTENNENIECSKLCNYFDNKVSLYNLLIKKLDNSTLSFVDDENNSIPVNELFRFIVKCDHVGSFTFWFKTNCFDKDTIVPQIAKLKDIKIIDKETRDQKIELLLATMDKTNTLFVTYVSEGNYTLTQENVDSLYMEKELNKPFFAFLGVNNNENSLNVKKGENFFDHLFEKTKEKKKILFAKKEKDVSKIEKKEDVKIEKIEKKKDTKPKSIQEDTTSKSASFNGFLNSQVFPYFIVFVGSFLLLCNFANGLMNIFRNNTIFIIFFLCVIGALVILALVTNDIISQYRKGTIKIPAIISYALTLIVGLFLGGLTYYFLHENVIKPSEITISSINIALISLGSSFGLYVLAVVAAYIIGKFKK